MKLLTWNIWKGRHLDGVIDLLKKESPDIIALQEIKEIDGKNQARIIAETLGYEYIYCKSFRTDRHTPLYDLGNAVLSKFPITSTACHFLSKMDKYENSSKTEPRTAVEVNISYKGRSLRVIATHLGYSDNFGDSEIRMYQLDNLLKIIGDKECVLLGDFNSLPNSRVVSQLEEKLQNVDQDITEMSYTNMKDPEKKQYRIDYIFLDKSIPFQNFRIIKTDASDHNTLSIEI